VYDPITSNAGEAYSRGLEGEIVARPTRSWLLGFNFAWLDAAYDGGTQPDGKPLDKIPFSPEYTANLNAEYRRPVGRREAFAGAELLNRGEMFLTQDNQEDGRVGAHSLVNARLGLASPEAGWKVTLWGKNLTDEIVVQRLFDLYDLGIIGQKFVTLNEPLTFGLTLGYSF
jgi:iron complex outermembrane recepter protein